MKISRGFVLACIGVLAICLVSCDSTSSRETSTGTSGFSGEESGIETTEDGGAGKMYRQLTTNVLVDAEVLVPASSSVSVFRAVKQDFDPDVFRSWVEESVPVTDMSDKRSGKALTLEDGGSCLVMPGFVTVNRPFAADINTVFVPASDSPQNNASLFMTNTDLPFASEATVEKDVRAALAKIGLRNVGDCTIYSLDWQTLQSEAKKVLADPNNADWIQSGKMSVRSDWSESDDCYYLWLRDQIDGIPIIDHPYQLKTQDVYVDGTYIEVLYSQDGIQYLVAGTVYQPESAIRTASLLSVEDVLPEVKEKYDSIITEYSYTITQIALCYVPSPGDAEQSFYEMIPAYAFQVTEKGTDTDESGVATPHEFSFSLLYDATTGQEIV